MIGNTFGIDEYQIDTTKLLGQGAFGSVFVASKRNDPRPYCAKIIRGSAQDVDKELFILNFMKDKQNENIVNTFYANYVSEQQMYVIIMEKCDSDLDKEIKSRQNKKFPEQESIEIMKQLLNGYKILYQSQIVHRDIKPANILIGGGKYKIADFGVGKVYDADTNLKNMTKQGTPVFKAPELSQNYEWRQADSQFLEGQGQFGNQTMFGGDQERRKKIQHKVDIYSFGIMFYLLLTGTYPFELSVNGIMSFINQIKFTPFKINPQFGINPDLASLVEKMLLYSPIERIGFPELLQTQYFGMRLGTMFNIKQAFTQIQKAPIILNQQPKIFVIPQQKPVQDWLNNLRSLFLERCHENNNVPEVYRNYCDLCLQLANSQLDQNISQQLLQEYINKFLHRTRDDIQFKIEASLDTGYYIKEFMRVVQRQLIPKIFSYDLARYYGESYLKFMFIFLKLRNNEYNYWTPQQGYPPYQPFKDTIQKDAALTKEDLKKYLDNNY